MITIVLFTKERSRNSTSISATARWVETSSAEVISSAIRSDGSSSVESTITTRCFMPPESSIGYFSQDVVGEADQAKATAQLGQRVVVADAT